ncbi:sigma-70 family RNA polymerase sigma factor [Ornithinibacillus sp. L9]|uniref:Sigma-70 family RNA polymerase sigma factor n=1 Tax=Ornithinibacillus caprae TaxID=2678566 RepID=A0A6N8FB86_9BACI|nr:RNA polymerase sigma factor [Ornithinibacillus caprae]MUK86823.1 sigma-70 family RNA polymerase sigma factor [Ornithinibacillus caprae]
MNDHELIREILRGDQLAIQELHSRYVDHIFYYIFIQTNSYHDSEELLQDVFFKTARQLHQFEGKSSFKTWIFKIARNVVIDYYRKNNKRQYPITMDQNFMECIAGKDESAEKTVLRNLHIDEVMQTLDKLPKHYQTVLHLRFIEDFSIKETAEIMGKTILSVKALQNRARKALSEQINLEVSS